MSVIYSVCRYQVTDKKKVMYSKYNGGSSYSFSDEVDVSTYLNLDGGKA